MIATEQCDAPQAADIAFFRLQDHLGGWVIVAVLGVKSGNPMRPTFFAIAGCVLILASGCASDSGSMTKIEVETKLKRVLKLKEVSLTARPDGGYTGMGQASDGTKYRIDIDQKETDQSLWYSATSDSGELLAGGFQEFGPSWLRPLTQLRKGFTVILILFVVIGGGIVVARKLSRHGKRDEQRDQPKSPVSRNVESQYLDGDWVIASVRHISRIGRAEGSQAPPTKIELKSVEKRLEIHEAQLLTYMKLAEIKTGLLINFNATKLKDEMKRFVL